MPHPVPIHVPNRPPNNATYSQATTLGGLIFVSGQLGIDPNTGQLGLGMAEQTRQAIDNIVAILEAAGSALDRVAKVNVFITDFSQLPAMNSIYAQYFVHRPAKTTVEIACLDKGALIEIEVVASAQ